VLDKAAVSVLSLLIGTGYAIGGGLILLTVVTGVQVLSTFGLALITITSAYAVRRAVVAHDVALREAFELGRDHERLQSVRPS
jgi:hypothetical protein